MVLIRFSLVMALAIFVSLGIFFYDFMGDHALAQTYNHIIADIAAGLFTLMIFSSWISAGRKYDRYL